MVGPDNNLLVKNVHVKILINVMELYGIYVNEYVGHKPANARGTTELACFKVPHWVEKNDGLGFTRHSDQHKKKGVELWYSHHCHLCPKEGKCVDFSELLSPSDGHIVSGDHDRKSHNIVAARFGRHLTVNDAQPLPGNSGEHRRPM